MESKLNNLAECSYAVESKTKSVEVNMDNPCNGSGARNGESRKFPISWQSSDSGSKIDIGAKGVHFDSAEFSGIKRKPVALC